MKDCQNFICMLLWPSRATDKCGPKG